MTADLLKRMRLPPLERPRDTPLFEPFDQKTPHPKPADSDE